jgi:hypothetical protein
MSGFLSLTILSFISQVQSQVWLFEPHYSNTTSSFSMELKQDSLPCRGKTRILFNWFRLLWHANYIQNRHVLTVTDLYVNHYNITRNHIKRPRWFDELQFADVPKPTFTNRGIKAKLF